MASPAVNDKVTIFTAAMRSELAVAYEQYRSDYKETPWQSFVTTIPSTARLEQYPWMSAPPRLKRWLGKRKYSVPDYTKMIVPNLEYSAEQMVARRDIEDDQTGGYKLQMQSMARDVVNFPGRESVKILAACTGVRSAEQGQSITCFDGSSLFASSHTIGTGNNSLTFTSASNGSGDTTTHYIVSLIKSSVVKPVIWQQRKDDGLQDNGSTPQSREEKFIKMWYDYEGAAALGYWWDTCLTTITGLPIVTELQTCLKNIEIAFRTFKMDQADPTEDPWWPHQQINMDTATIVHLVNPAIHALLRTVLISDTIQAGTYGGGITNAYKGYGDLIATPFLIPSGQSG